MLVNDDMFNLIEYLPLDSVDLIIIDPPYGIGDKKLTHKEKDWNKSAESWDKFDSIQSQYDWYKKVFSFLWYFLKDNGSIFCFGSFHNIYQCGDILQRQLNAKIVNSLVWYKRNAMFNVTRSSLIESCEHCIWAAKGNDFYFDYEYSKTLNSGTQLRNVWTSSITETAERVGHPHQKPVWLYHRLVKLACPEGGNVLDPMAGSGTTEIVCKSLSINSLCIERNPEYYQKALKRLDIVDDLY